MLKQKQSAQASFISNDTLLRYDSRLSKYPCSLNFYTTPPEDQITLLEFERIALDRLQVLLAIDAARLRAKTDQDMYKLIDPILQKHLEVSRNSAVAGSNLYDQRLKDHYSHFILRLAYCKTSDLQSWFLKQETFLFRLRWLQASPDERKICLREAKLDLEQVSLEEMATILMEIEGSDRQKAMATIKSVYTDQTVFYKVPFEDVCDLVARRLVVCHGGFAFVPDSERISLILNEFSTNLKAALAFTQKALPRMDEDDRIMPILFSLAKQSLSKEYQISSGDGKSYRADDVPGLVPSFPPCMFSLAQVLQRDCHLKHNGRIQFGLFLKGIGLTLEESLIFWRRSFSKMSDDEFNKKGYPYNIRYNYGMEGKRTNYTPYSCVKMISSLPGPNDTHGCPFRQFSSERLIEMMESYGVSGSEALGVTKKAKEGHYQLACTKLFEVSQGKIHEAADEIEGIGKDQDGALMLLQGIDHPNRWFEMAMRLKAT